MPEEKTCPKCSKTLPLSDFSVDRTRKDGHKSWCKVCSNTWHAAYRESHREEIREKDGHFRENNREKRRAANRAWAAANRAAERESTRLYRLNNPEKVREAERAWRLNNAEKTRARQLRRFYGMTPSEYTAMLAAQGGVCAICHQPERSQTGKEKPLCVDHDHITGKARGLLCSRCNTALGFFGDDITRLKRAERYLQKYASLSGGRNLYPLKRKRPAEAITRAEG